MSSHQMAHYDDFYRPYYEILNVLNNCPTFR